VAPANKGLEASVEWAVFKSGEELPLKGRPEFHSVDVAAREIKRVSMYLSDTWIPFYFIQPSPVD